MDPQACLDVVADESLDLDARRAAADNYNRWRHNGGARGKIKGREVDLAYVGWSDRKAVFTWRTVFAGRRSVRWSSR